MGSHVATITGPKSTGLGLFAVRWTHKNPRSGYWAHVPSAFNSNIV